MDTRSTQKQFDSEKINVLKKALMALIARKPFNENVCAELYKVTQGGGADGKAFRDYILEDVVPMLDDQELFLLTEAVMRGHAKLALEGHMREGSTLSRGLYKACAERFHYQFDLAANPPEQMAILTNIIFQFERKGKTIESLHQQYAKEIVTNLGFGLKKILTSKQQDVMSPVEIANWMRVNQQETIKINNMTNDQAVDFMQRIMKMGSAKIDELKFNNVSSASLYKRFPALMGYEVKASRRVFSYTPKTKGDALDQDALAFMSKIASYLAELSKEVGTPGYSSQVSNYVYSYFYSDSASVNGMKRTFLDAIMEAKMKKRDIEMIELLAEGVLVCKDNGGFNVNLLLAGVVSTRMKQTLMELFKVDEAMLIEHLKHAEEMADKLIADRKSSLGHAGR